MTDQDPGEEPPDFVLVWPVDGEQGRAERPITPPEPPDVPAAIEPVDDVPGESIDQLLDELDPTAVGGLLGTMVHEIDALTASSGGLQTLLAERLAAVEESVAQAWRSQIDQVDELRRRTDEGLDRVARATNEQVVYLRSLQESMPMLGREELEAELTVALGSLRDIASAHQELLHAVADMTGGVRDTRAVLDEQVRAVEALAARVAELGPGPAPAPLADRSAEIIDALDAVQEQLAALHERGSVEAPAPVADRSAEIIDGLDAVQEQLAALHERDSVGASSPVADRFAEIIDGLDAVQEQLLALREAAPRAPKPSRVADRSAEIIDGLEALREEVEALRDVRPATPAAAVGEPADLVTTEMLDDLREAVLGQLDGLRDDVARLRRRVPLRVQPPAVATVQPADVDAIVERVVERLTEHFEVIAGDE